MNVITKQRDFKASVQGNPRDYFHIRRKLSYQSFMARGSSTVEIVMVHNHSLADMLAAGSSPAPFATFFSSGYEQKRFSATWLNSLCARLKESFKEVQLRPLMPEQCHAQARRCSIGGKGRESTGKLQALFQRLTTCALMTGYAGVRIPTYNVIL